jgi:methyl-accepting chemotaxis protein
MTIPSSSAYTKFWNDLANGISQVNEFERIRKDGSSIWIQASYTTVKNNKWKSN